MTLPIDAVLPDLLRTANQNNALVLQAPPGTGKTTRVPLALLGANFLGDKRIVMLEPRRLAARSAARFMASLLGEDVGKTVGYRTRLDTRVSQDTRIEVVTEGILTRLLQDDAELADYGVVIFDEFHERSLQADLGLALVRECQQVLREDLRMIVMSATLDVAPIAKLLGEAPVLRCEGQTFPVETRYRAPGRTPLLDHLAQIVLETLRTESGSVLVFLPGEGEIRRLAMQLEERLPEDVVLAPLYGQLAAEQQDIAISPAAAGRRKLVLATAIAETSLTIEGIRVVIDSGQLRLPFYDPNSAMTRLITQRVALANADQRRGRAGRLGPGVCVRLWSEDEQQRLQAFAAPEIQQADLTGTVLELAAWGVHAPEHLAWLDVPPASNWAQARELLQTLTALDDRGVVTPHGKAMLKLGLPPRLGHMVIRGRERGWGRLAAELAALLAERDLLSSDRGTDMHERIMVLRGEHSAAGVDRGRLQRVREGARRLLPRGGVEQPEHNDSLGMLLALAFPDRIGSRRSGQAPRYLLSNGRGAVLRDEDGLARAEWLVAAELDGQVKEARVFLAASLSQTALEEVMADAIRSVDVLAWDTATQSVLARRQRRLGALVLEDRPAANVDPEKIRETLLTAIRAAGLTVFAWSDELLQLRARVKLMHGLEPEHWPDFSEAALLRDLEIWAGPFLQGISRFSQLSNFPLRDALLSQLDWSAQQRLDEALPPRLTVPSGSSIAIDYTAEHGPVLSVKLQEMFGLTKTPVLAAGCIPLTIHLLSPAQRPVAVTSDLASFWNNAYSEVRKDLRGRYPRHPWPEDPLTAVAQRGVKKRPE